MLELKFVAKDNTLADQEDKESGMLVLPGDVEDDWNQVVARIVKGRVTEVPKEGRIEIFCFLEGRKQTDDLLTNIIMTEAARALDELVLDPVSFISSSVTFTKMLPLCSICRKDVIIQEVLRNFSCPDRTEWLDFLEIF